MVRWKTTLLEVNHHRKFLSLIAHELAKSTLLTSTSITQCWNILVFKFGRSVVVGVVGQSQGFLTVGGLVTTKHGRTVLA